MPRNAPYGFTRGQLAFSCAIPAGTGLVAAVSAFLPAFGFTIERVRAYVDVVGAGAGATRTFRVLKNAATVVASATVTLASTDTLGEEQVFTVTAADATYDDDDTLTVDWPAAGAVAFTAGRLHLVIQYRQRAQRQT